MEKLIKRIGLQYFAEPEEPPGEIQTPSTPAAPTNYDELLKNDSKFQSFVSQMTANAVLEYQKKQEVLNSEKLSEAEKLKTMNAEEKIEYYRIKLEKSEAARQRMMEAVTLKSTTEKMLSDGGIPAEFIDDFDFETATAESVKKRVSFLSGYEIYPKGTFEARVNDTLNERLKQKSPESHGGGSQGTDEKLRSYFGI